MLDRVDQTRGVMDTSRRPFSRPVTLGVRRPPLFQAWVCRYVLTAHWANRLAAGYTGPCVNGGFAALCVLLLHAELFYVARL